MKGTRPDGASAVGWAGFGVALAFTLATLEDYGIASDVGNYFFASLAHLEWWRGLWEGVLAGDPMSALDREEVLRHWAFSLDRIPHPPLSRQLGGLSYAAFGGLLEPLAAYRVGAAVAYAAIVGMCGDWATRRTGSRVAGIGAAGAALALPALFAYGHLALTDIYVAAFWLGAVYCLDRHYEVGGGRTMDRWLAACGALLGAACATKFTGVLLLPALALQAAWGEAAVPAAARRGRPGGEEPARGVQGTIRAAVPKLGLLGLVALALWVAANPVVWVAPLRGVGDYLAAGLGRVGRESAQLTTQYFGELYAYRPPWHYPFVWTAVILPIPLSAAAIGGVVSRRRAGTLVPLSLLSLGILYGVLLLPGTPLHDGVRLFLPALPFLCLLAGVGVHGFVEAVCHRRWEERRPAVAAVAISLVLLFPGLRSVQYHPYQLSYFNALVGGLPGADARGLEVTAMKEALTPELLATLADRMPRNAVVDPGFFLEEMCFYRAFGYLPRGWVLETSLRRGAADDSVTWTCDEGSRPIAVFRDRAPRSADFVFVLNREGMYTARERALVGFGGRPFFELRVEEVPLVRVYRVGPPPMATGRPRGTGGPVPSGGAPTPERSS